MPYAQFKNPPLPKPTQLGSPVRVTGTLRVVSYLWDTTVDGNPFGTDGPQSKVDQAWPGDTKAGGCRQWHGVTLTATFRKDGSVDRDSIELTTSSYSGTTRSVGFIGKATVTDRHVTQPKIGQDKLGAYVEVKTLLGTRVGAFVPDLDVGAPSIVPSDPLVTFGQHLFEEVVEQASEEQYLGTNELVPKIFSYAFLRLYASGKAVGGWVSNRRGNGFVSQAEIVAGQLSSSWIPEHHVYLNGSLAPALSRVPSSPGHADEFLAWMESGPWFSVRAFRAMASALGEWAAHTPMSAKTAAAAEFSSRYPDYFIGTDF